MVTLKYTNPEHTIIQMTQDDGTVINIPVDTTNRHYRQHIMRGAVTIDDSVSSNAAIITAAMVIEEKLRRERSFLSVSTETERLSKISDGMREGITLLNKGKTNWTTTDKARAQRLNFLSQKIDSLVASAETLIAMSPIPANYTDDSFWV